MGKIKILVFLLELCLIYSQCGSFATLKPTWLYKLVQFTVIFLCHHIWLHTGSDKGLIQTTRLSPNLFTYFSVLALCECVFDEAEEPDKTLGGRMFPRSPEWQRNNAVTASVLILVSWDRGTTETMKQSNVKPFVFFIFYLWTYQWHIAHTQLYRRMTK